MQSGRSSLILFRLFSSATTSAIDSPTLQTWSTPSSTLDASPEDPWRAFKFFLANFRILHYGGLRWFYWRYWEWNNLKPWRSLEELSLRLNVDKPRPTKWLAKLPSHCLGEQPIIQCTHNFLRILKPDPGMSIQQQQTVVRLEYQICNFPSTVNDRLQRNFCNGPHWHLQALSELPHFSGESAFPNLTSH